MLLLIVKGCLFLRNCFLYFTFHWFPENISEKSIEERIAFYEKIKNDKMLERQIQKEEMRKLLDEQKQQRKEDIAKVSLCTIIITSLMWLLFLVILQKTQFYFHFIAGKILFFQEREKRREEKRLQEATLREYNRVREDLICDDLKVRLCELCCILVELIEYNSVKEYLISDDSWMILLTTAQNLCESCIIFMQSSFSHTRIFTPFPLII